MCFFFFNTSGFQNFLNINIESSFCKKLSVSRSIKLTRLRQSKGKAASYNLTLSICLILAIYFTNMFCSFGFGPVLSPRRIYTKYQPFVFQKSIGCRVCIFLSIGYNADKNNPNSPDMLCIPGTEATYLSFQGTFDNHLTMIIIDCIHFIHAQ